MWHTVAPSHHFTMPLPFTTKWARQNKAQRLQPISVSLPIPQDTVTTNSTRQQSPDTGPLSGCQFSMCISVSFQCVSVSDSSVCQFPKCVSITFQCASVAVSVSVPSVHQCQFSMCVSGSFQCVSVFNVHQCRFSMSISVSFQCVSVPKVCQRQLSVSVKHGQPRGLVRTEHQPARRQAAVREGYFLHRHRQPGAHCWHSRHSRPATRPATHARSSLAAVGGPWRAARPTAACGASRCWLPAGSCWARPLASAAVAETERAWLVPWFETLPPKVTVKGLCPQGER